jgi:pantoate--beta-alanine ligase
MLCDQARRREFRVAFVPTMGALHDGHLALVREAQRRAPYVVVSIFVNPTQFGPGEDLARYPRDLDGDLAKLAVLSPSVVFAPEVAELYQPGDETRVRVGGLSEPLCGRLRPGHFEGVATVVAKLLSLVGPCDVLLGRKDAQQVLVVQRMITDLFMPVRVVAVPTVREPDGLAMSSRNAYLSAAGRQSAVGIVRALDRAARSFERGERDARELERQAREPLEAERLVVEYVEVRDPETLAVFQSRTADRALLAIAARVEGTRLIDNICLGEEPRPLRNLGPA